MRVDASKNSENDGTWEMEMKALIYCGEKQQINSFVMFCHNMIFCCLHWRFPHWLEKLLWGATSVRKSFRGFVPTLVGLKPVAFCASCFCRSWSVETSWNDVAWPKKAFRIVPAIHFRRDFRWVQWEHLWLRIFGERTRIRIHVRVFIRTFTNSIDPTRVSCQ